MKLTVVGGGGVRAPLLASALARRRDGMGVQELCLFDIDAERLAVIGPLARYAAEKSGGQFQIAWTDRLDEALENASAVITTIRAGGDVSRSLDERIAVDHGVLGQETTGAGGFAMAVRSIPAVTSCARRMTEVCPDAWLMNFTNPAGLVTQALVDTFPKLKIAGICDTPLTIWGDVAGLFGRTPADVPIRFFGLNHLSWMSAAWVDGEDVVPGLIVDGELPEKIHELSMFDPALLRLIGMIPNEYLYYYYYRERALANIIAAGETRGEQVRRLGEGLLRDLAEIDPARNPEAAWTRYARYRDSRHGTYMDAETGRQSAPAPSASATSADAPSVDEGEGYAGVALDILSASTTDGLAPIVANVPNRGAITGMRDDDVVEVVCRCNDSGLEPVPVGDVPESALLLMQQVKLYERLTVEAVRARSRDLAVEALLTHPLVGSYSLASSLVDAYLKGHGELVGEWG